MLRCNEVVNYLDQDQGQPYTQATDFSIAWNKEKLSFSMGDQVPEAF
jgi:hypothetical protein